MTPQPRLSIVMADAPPLDMTADQSEAAARRGPGRPRTKPDADFDKAAAQALAVTAAELRQFIPRRYFLSPTACAGIIRRAARRGKTLPPPFARALQAVADSGRTSTSAAG